MEESSEEPKNNQHYDQINENNSPSLLDIFGYPITKTSKRWEKIEENHHILQVLENKDKYQSRADVKFTRILDSSFQRLVYRRRKGEVKTVCHWGQRKLLMSEIEFLAKYGRKGDIVVYAGAAPGTHIQFLSDLFPGVYFVLVDPAPFTVKENEFIKIYQDLFTNEMAQEYSKEKYHFLDESNNPHSKILFISDIRSASFHSMTEEETEARVKFDMDLQKKWVETIKPRHSMLKFRLSWIPGKTLYLKGDVHLPVWGPITTSESRLITPEKIEEHLYDNSEYEQQMFYFNTEYRVARFLHNVEGEGICHCYDCSAEIYILFHYLKSSFSSRLQPNATLVDIWTEISKLSFQISRKIASDRTLRDPNPDPGKRHEIISKRQFINGKPAHMVAEERKKFPQIVYHEPKDTNQVKRVQKVVNHGPRKGDRSRPTPSVSTNGN